MLSSHAINDAILRRPALPVAVIFILGIASHRILPHTPIIWFSASVLLLLIALAIRHHATMCSLSIALVIFILGCWSAQLAHFGFPRNHIANFATDEPKLAWVEGIIERSPTLYTPPVGGRPMPDRESITIEVQSVRSVTGSIPATGELPVSISPPAAGLAAGQKVRVLGRLERPEPAMNPGQFDAAEHDRLERRLVSMQVSRPYDVQVLSTPAASVFPKINLWNASGERLDAGFPASRSSDRALLRALVFGDREPDLRPIQDDFSHTGTTHLLASNGARIAVFAGALYLLCRLLFFPPRLKLFVVATGVTIFGFLTLPAAEALRPACVCVAVGWGLMGRRSSDAIQMLSLVAIALLVYRPLDLYLAGFQLSFVIVLGMLICALPAVRWVEGWFKNPDREVAESFMPPPRWRRMQRAFTRWLIRLTVVSTVAWAFAIPLVACHFEQFNPWTVPFGLVLSLPAFFALIAGFAKIVLSALLPSLSGTWAAFALIPAGWLHTIVHWMARAPLADVPITRPSVPSILLYYALLIPALVPWSWRPLRWCARCAPVGACAMLLTLPVAGSIIPGKTHTSALKITLLSVGAGQCAVIEPTGGGAVLLNAGSSTLMDPAHTCIEPFLRHEQRRWIDSIFLSHGDFDHISATRALVSEFDVHAIFASPHFRRHASESWPCNSLLQWLDSTHQSPRLIVAGDHVTIAKNVQVEVLWPPADCKFNSNNSGLVLRVTCDGRSILFPADIQEPAERELLKNPGPLRSDILIAPHHGSSESTTAAFIAAVNPKAILASNDSRLTTKQRIFDSECRSRTLLRTSRCGAITIEVESDGSTRVSSFLPGTAPVELPP